MPDPVWDPDGKARAALDQVVKEYGARALSSPSVLDNALPDLLPDSPRQISLIIATSGSSVVGSLQERLSAGMDPDSAVRAAATQLAEQTPYDAAGCRWVTAEFARALGYPVSDDAGVTGPPAAPPVPATPVTPDLAAAPVNPDLALTIPPDRPAEAVAVTPAVEVTPAVAVTPGAPTPPRRRSWTTLVVLVVVVGGLLVGTATTKTWPFSGPKVVALAKLLPVDASKCRPTTTAYQSRLVGSTATVTCSVRAIDGVVMGFQFDNASDYAASFAAFNKAWYFNTSSAKSYCPVSNQNHGVSAWYTLSKTGLYPRRAGQVLECYATATKQSGGDIYPVYVWTFPSEDAFVQVFAAANVTMTQLDHWWATNAIPKTQ